MNTVTSVGSTLNFLAQGIVVKRLRAFALAGTFLVAACCNEPQAPLLSLAESAPVASEAHAPSSVSAGVIGSDIGAQTVTPAPVAGDIVAGGDVSDDARPCGPFLQFAAGVDNSASIPGAAAPRPTIEDFAKLQAHVARCGGSVAVTPITDRAQAYVSLYVPPPPRRATAKAASSMDLITQTEHQAVEERLDREYASALDEWRQLASTRIAQFHRDIESVLQPANWSQRTNIQAALDVLDSFFLQPSTIPINQRRQVLVIFSDGKDDVATTPLRPLASRPTFILVNQLDLGDFAAFDVTRVGDGAAAMRLILADGRS